MKQKDGSLKPAYQGSDTQQTGHFDPVLQRYVSCHDIYRCHLGCISSKDANDTVVGR